MINGLILYYGEEELLKSKGVDVKILNDAYN